MHMFRPRPGILLPLALAGSLAFPDAAVAQAGTEVLAQQSLRPYWLVFIAYGLAWLLLLGWLFSIGRRMRGLEGEDAQDRDA